MSTYNEDARQKAIQYLKSRNIYILDNPKKIVSLTTTDVAKTIKTYLEETTAPREQT